MRQKRSTSSLWTQCGAPLLRSVIDASPAGIFLCDRARKILAVNPAFSRVTGYQPDHVLGKTPDVLRSGRHTEVFEKRLWTKLEREGTWEGQLWHRKRSGAVIPHWVQLSALREDEDEPPTHYLGMLSDMRKLKLPDERTVHLAYHDPLTGLANRYLFTDRLKRTLLRAERANRIAAVVFIDLDDFKPVNDRHGHAVGDELLKTVSKRLERSIRRTDTAARLGGDEFAVVLDGFNDGADLHARVQSIFDGVVCPLKHEGLVLEVSASMGIAEYPRDGLTAEEVLEAADQAMYRAKRAGKNQTATPPLAPALQVGWG